ncbi:MAG: iron-sulfur cluster assembly scaffold protein [Verrucomicrobiota bacterium]
MLEKEIHDLYAPLIVRHSRDPFGRNPEFVATHRATALNPLCGDEVTLSLLVQKKVIIEAGFTARGCVLTTASASILCEQVVGASLSDLDADDLWARLNDTEELAILTKAMAAHPPRKTCLTLAWNGLREAISTPIL